MVRGTLGGSIAAAALAAIVGAGARGEGPRTPPPEATAVRTAAPPRTLAAALDGRAVHALVELHESPTTVVHRRALAWGEATARAAAIAQLARVRAEQLVARAAIARAGLPSTRELYRLERVFNGVVLLTTADGLEALRRIPGVRAVHVLTPRPLLNAYSAPFLGVPAAWAAASPLRGEGVKVGIIDSGIDYTHANLGGSGDPAEHAANDPSTLDEGNFPNAKVVGGTDFVGASYDASDAATATPAPDPDPMDYDGHGSHVAGTVAGLGVTAAGATYAGPYDGELEAAGLAIGPGMAPAAELYALKVFGDVTGTTAVAPLAVEWAVDPDGDGSFDDRLDVVNLSLGGAYGTSSDPEPSIYRNAVLTGLVVVAAAGNSGDVYFVAGSPGTIPEVIGVAASQHDHTVYAGLRVDAPGSVAGLLVAGTAAFGPGAPVEVSGELAAAEPADVCAPLVNPEALLGKVAILRRGTCTFESKVAAVEAAGAIGAVLVNNVQGKPGGMGADTGRPITIPSVLVGQADGEALLAALAVEAVTVTFSDAFEVVRPEEADNVAGFSSRGPSRHGARPILKPDVAAPGAAIVSTAVGTGAGGVAASGTSMAAPHVAGVMALLRQAHPDWDALELKALVMNTAGGDLYGHEDEPRPRVSTMRMGAGRADVAAAITSPVIAFDAAAPERVSLSFETVDVVGTAIEPRTVRLRNKGLVAATYAIALAPVVAMEGVEIVGPTDPTVIVPAGGAVDVPIVLRAEASRMIRGRDPTVSERALDDAPRFWLAESSGHVVFEPVGPDLPALRVPYLAVPTPASTMRAAAGLATTASAGAATLTLAGVGISSAAGASPPPLGALSLVTPLELLFVGPEAPPMGTYPPGTDPDDTDLGDLRYVGVASDLADRNGVVANTTLFFGVVMQGRWGSPLESSIRLLLRRRGAPGWEYELGVSDSGWDPAAGQHGADLPGSFLRDLATGEAERVAPMNGVEADWFYLPTFLADAVILPVPARALGLTEAAAGLEIQVRTRHLGRWDESPVLPYDVRRPGLVLRADPSLNLPIGAPPLRRDQPGVTLEIAYDLDAARANWAGGLLLLHHLNASGGRGEAVPVQGLTCLADADCAPTPGRPRCEPRSGVCVGCLTADDCEGGAPCDAGGSRRCDCRIASSSPCDPGAYCDGATGACVLDCRAEGARPCAGGTWCSAAGGECLPVENLVTTAPEPPGEHCAAGGLRIESGLDDDGDGVLEPPEVDWRRYVCDDPASAFAVRDELAGEHCPAGGKRIETGLDTDGDGALDPEEVTETTYLCDPLPDGDDDGACGCSLRPSRPASTFLLLLALPLVAFLRRRDRIQGPKRS